MLPSNKISTFPIAIVPKDTIFKQQKKYKKGSYLEPDLREIQQQPPQVFWRKRCSQEFCKIHRKTPVLSITCTLKNFLKFFKDQSFMKKSLQHRCFPVNVARFLRPPFSQNTSVQMLLEIALQLTIVSYLEPTFSKLVRVASIEIFYNCLNQNPILYQTLSRIPQGYTTNLVQ